MMIDNCYPQNVYDTLLVNQELINAAEMALNINTEYSISRNLIYTNNDTIIEQFQRNYLPLLDKYKISHSNNSPCSYVRSLESDFPLRYILQTYVQPFVILFTLITNCLITIILTHPTMRNPTNLILLGIAISDLLTVLLPLPIYLCFLFTTIFRTNLTINKGYFVMYFTTLLPTICHTTSIWLTVLLAIQRFMYVHFPLQVNHICLCQWKPVLLSLFFTFLLAFCFQLPNMCTTKFEYAIDSCIMTMYDNNNTNYNYNYIFQMSNSFQFNLNNQIIRFNKINLMKCTPMSQNLFFALILIRVLLVNLIPCIVLTILTGLLIVAMRKFIQNRQKLLGSHESTIPKRKQTFQLSGKNKSNGNISESKSLKQSSKTMICNTIKTTNTNITPTSISTAHTIDNSSCSDHNLIRKSYQSSHRSNVGDADSTSKMMLVILSIFLITEIPTTICICIYAFMTFLNIYLPPVIHLVIETCNFLVILSYPANFFVYLAMSRQFKTTFKMIFSRFHKTSTQM